MNNLSAALDLVQSSDAPNENQSLRALCEEILDVVARYAVNAHVADWPFDNFWSDPSEPRHSKMLDYFVNPQAKHGCGSYLLSKLVSILVDALPVGHRFPCISGRDEDFWRACRVQPETRRGDNQSGQIDLFITRDCDYERFAIIVENKIKRAKNQRNQLQNYVAKAKGRQAKFSESEIFVFFLPLIDDCRPNEEDLQAIEALGVIYQQITFKEHIGRWLNAVLDAEWPSHFSTRLREHLSYYRNFIDHLVNKRKAEVMSSKILERLIQASAKAKTSERKLPSWYELDQLETSLREMKPFFERMLRGELLLRVEQVLKAKGLAVRWYYIKESEIAVPCVIDSPFHELLDKDVNLGVPVEEGICVSLGAYPHEGELNATFWMSCLRTDTEQAQARVEAGVLEVAQQRFGPDGFNNRPYFKWGWCESVTYENCQEETVVDELVNDLIDLHGKLLARLALP